MHGWKAFQMWLRNATEFQMMFQAQLSQRMLEKKRKCKASVTETRQPFLSCTYIKELSSAAWSSTMMIDLCAFCCLEFQLLWGTRKISGLLPLEEVFPNWLRPGWALENAEKEAVSICIHNTKSRRQHKEENSTAQGTVSKISPILVPGSYTTSRWRLCYNNTL